MQGAKRRRTIGAAKTAPQGAALPRPAALAVSLAATL